MANIDSIKVGNTTYTLSDSSAVKKVSFGGTNYTPSDGTVTLPTGMYKNYEVDIKSGTGLTSGTSWQQVALIDQDDWGFSFTKGVWLINTCVQFPTNATGMRGVGFKIDGSGVIATDVTGAITQTTVSACPNVGTNVTNCCIHEITTSAPVLHVMARQNSGSAMGTSSNNTLRVRVRVARLF